eukprot:gnl/TRDRNA2_/TRDRNA2_177692_c7_seq7.p1 gnl/TRDRNA2_/TRDRNA2_177692_c7~~gnl/TRDRNA2_/TRDRNA2_177692_c7_seq7.p1  ORF type:complete len:432 (+),score=132.73 gnl/TRDRNA2_/TRDRNA2_177692_c7_seq7:81-1376(+)
MAVRILFVWLVMSPLALYAIEQQETAAADMAVNPIRKVVTMLQNMQQKVEAEGKKEEELFEKFMCYCKGGKETLLAGIDLSNKKIKELTSSIAASEGEKGQLQQDLMAAKTGRDDAKSAMAQAAGVREKEAAAFAKASADLKTNIGALDKAIPAIENGMSGSFVQTEAAAGLKNYVMLKSELADVDREDVLSFLSNAEGYAPQSGQIVGILKTLHDEMTKELSDTSAAEDAAIKTYEELVAAKTKEGEALTAQIEEKSVRLGDVSMEAATMKNDLEDTTEAVAEDTKFAADLEKQCASKEAEWDERCKLRSEEILAIADTIKILNDDDALELFKKTLPGSASFVQIQVTQTAMRAHALALINQARNKPGSHRQNLDLIALALHGKAKGFEVVTKMIEGMIANLHKEQEDDDAKKRILLDTVRRSRRQEERT